MTMFVDAKTLATAECISIRNAHIALERGAAGKPWRGHYLQVVGVEVQGGDSGKGRLVAVDSLPAQIQRKIRARNTATAYQEKPLDCPYKPWQLEEQRDRLRVLAPILATEKLSRERGNAVKNAIARVHVIRGVETTFTKQTLYRWLRDFEADGPAGLMPSQRSDGGQPRVLLSKAWDYGIDLSQAQKEAIAKTLIGEAQSMVANDGTSGREVTRLSKLKLSTLSKEAGSKLSDAKLRKVCNLSGKWPKQFDKFRLVYRYDKDHGRFQNEQVPRIQRQLSKRPMDQLIGDVHYIDILVEENGEPVKVRLIAWMDNSSHFIWIEPVFLTKSNGVTQKHVAKSLEQVVFCKHGGIPKETVLDNGGEYSELGKAIARFSNISDNQGGFFVSKSAPYSPQSKGQIEGLFQVLQGIYQSFDGYIGGDRTNKRLVGKGKVVEPYRKGFKQLKQDIADAVAIYNDRPQQGLLEGLSPLQMLERKIKDTGFVARVPNQDAFDVVYSKTRSYKINQGCIKIGNVRFRASFFDGIIAGTKIEVSIPLRDDQTRVFVQYGDRKMWVYAMQKFAPDDKAGAAMAQSLNAGVSKAVETLRGQVDPSVSTFENQKAAVRKVVPDAPEPEAWFLGIDIDQSEYPTKREPQFDPKYLQNMDRYLAEHKAEREKLA